MRIVPLLLAMLLLARSALAGEIREFNVPILERLGCERIVIEAKAVKNTLRVTTIRSFKTYSPPLSRNFPTPKVSVGKSRHLHGAIRSRLTGVWHWVERAAWAAADKEDKKAAAGGDDGVQGPKLRGSHLFVEAADPIGDENER